MKDFNENPIEIIPYNTKNKYSRVIELSSADFNLIGEISNGECNRLLYSFLSANLRNGWDAFRDKSKEVNNLIDENHYDYKSLIEYNWGILGEVYDNSITPETKIYAFILNKEFYDVVESCEIFSKMSKNLLQINDINVDLFKEELLKMQEFLIDFHNENKI